MNSFFEYQNVELDIENVIFGNDVSNLDYFIDFLENVDQCNECEKKKENVMIDLLIHRLFQMGKSLIVYLKLLKNYNDSENEFEEFYYEYCKKNGINYVVSLDFYMEKSFGKIYLQIWRNFYFKAFYKCSICKNYVNISYFGNIFGNE